MNTHSNELYHHGVQGQKWGIRRYQNEDGTLTAEGRARYGREKSRELNRNDRKIAGVKAYQRQYAIAASSYGKRYKKALKADNSSRAAKNKEKYRINKAKEKEQTKKIEEYEKKNKEIIDSLIKDNYDVKVSAFPRISMTKGEMAVGALIAAADTVFPFTAGLGYVYLGSHTTKGSNYSVKTKTK